MIAGGKGEMDLEDPMMEVPRTSLDGDGGVIVMTRGTLEMLY